MVGLENVYADISYSRQDISHTQMIDELGDLCFGRTMVYAPVDQPRAFVSDMKKDTGRLMDFNQGMNSAF